MKFFIRYAIFAFIIFATISIFELGIFRVEGTSMFPALQDGDICFSYSKMPDGKISINYNDVVLVDYKDKKLVKRVIGLPGDFIKIDQGLLFVNDTIVQTPGLIFDMTTGKTSIELNSDQYYILGDNREVSYDSRSFGPVNSEKIKGKVFFKWHSPTSI